MRPGASGLVLAAALFAPDLVIAQDAPRFELRMPFDPIVGIGSGVVGVLLDREKVEWDGLSPCEGLARAPSAEERLAFELMDPAEGLCDDTSVPAIDRWVLDQGFESARILSDVGVGLMMAAPLGVAVGQLAGEDEAWTRTQEATMIAAETYGLTFLLTSVVKLAVRRPRPLTHRADFDKEVRWSGDARLSFFSGHSAMSFAAASLLAVLLIEREGVQPASVLGASAGYLGAALVAYLRIAARKHFLTDVLVGAAVGTTLGLLVPLLHLSPDRPPTASGTAAGLGPDPGYHPVVGLGGAF